MEEIKDKQIPAPVEIIVEKIVEKEVIKRVPVFVDLEKIIV